MSNDAKNSNSQTIFNGVTATVVAAILIGSGTQAISAIHRDDGLSASVMAARVAPLPEPFIEHMLNAGCDDSVPLGSDLAAIQTHDARVRACVDTVTRVLDTVKSNNFRQVRVQVGNNGRAPETNVRLNAPGFDYARVFGTNKAIHEFTSGQPIVVGDLAPGETAEVLVWAEQPYDVGLNDVALYSNSGKATTRILWGDNSTTDENGHFLESLIITGLNNGWAPLLAVVFAIGALMLVALLTTLVEFMFKKRTPVLITPATS